MLAISVREPFWKARDLYSRAFSLCAAFLYSQAILKCSRFLLASHSEKLAISIRAPFLCAQRVLFASHSEKLVISTRAPFFVRSVILLASHSKKLAIFLLFASHSEKLAISVRTPCWKAPRLVFFGFAQWNISIVVLYISLPLCMGESDISFKKTFCLMNIRPQDFLSHEPTLWFGRH